MGAGGTGFGRLLSLEKVTTLGTAPDDLLVPLEYPACIDVGGKIFVAFLVLLFSHAYRFPDQCHGLLRVPGNSGKSVSLADFSTIGYQQSPGVITRKNGKRYIPLDIQYEGMKEKDFTGRLRTYLGCVNFHDDFYYEFDESLIERQKGRIIFVLTLVIAVFSVYTILGIILKSFHLFFLQYEW